MSSTAQPGDVNAAFAAELADQIQAAAARHADFDARVANGKLIPLAVSSTKRSSALPDVPTTVEAGYANSDFDFYIGMWVPAKTPRDVVGKLHQETVKALQNPAVQGKLANLGVEPMIMTPEAFDARVAKEVATAAVLAKAAGIAAH